jgi:hypothetical protein
MAGVFLRRGEQLVRMREVPYEAEVVLQDLLEQHPEVLASEDAGDAPASWVLVRREAAVALGDTEPLRGMLDHLFLDREGVPTIVEVKLGRDTRIRREVVGQMLDYAANAGAHWNEKTLSAWFEDSCSRQGTDPEDVLRAAFPGLDDIDDYWETVRTNLAAHKLRLVFVADLVPPPLRRIVEYLNRQMTETEVLAIEVTQYADEAGEHQMIVPRIVGQTEAARAAKSRSKAPRWNRASLLATFAERGGDGHVELAQRLFAWADARGDLDENFGRGTKDGSWQTGYWDPSRYLWPFVLYTYGRIEIQFQHIAKYRPFVDLAQRAELRTRLEAIDGVTIAPDLLDKRPSIAFSALAPEGALEQFTAALDWAYDQAGAAR